MQALREYLPVDKDRKWEEGARPFADLLYKQLFPGIEIDRKSCSGSLGLSSQYQDIDLFVKFPGFRKSISISEKFRRSNFGDMLIEIYDERHFDNKGWGLYGKADRIFYLVPTSNGKSGRLYIMKESEVKAVCDLFIREYGDQIRSFIEDKRISVKKVSDTGVCIRRTLHSNKQTVFLCVPWGTLKNLGVNVQIYPLSSDMNDYLLSKK